MTPVRPSRVMPMLTSRPPMVSHSWASKPMRAPSESATESSAQSESRNEPKMAAVVR